MKRSNLGYFLAEGVRGVFLHGFMSFAAVCVTVACLVIMGSFSLILINLSSMITELEQDNEILAYVDESLSDAEAKSVGSQINLIDNVLQSEFVSRERAMEDFVSQYDDTTIFDGMDSSTFRHRYRIHLEDIEKMQETVDAVSSVPGIVKVNAHLEISEGFVTVQNIMQVVSIAVISLLFIVSVFIISNTVKLALFARREEIAIMKMVGATNSFIRWPFVVEGFILGFLGAAIGFFAEWGIYQFIGEQISSTDSLNLVTILPFTDVMGPMIAAYAITGFMVGVVGSLFSIRKFLKV